MSPILTWDSKITTVISMLGGFADAVADGLQSDKVLDTFTSKIKSEFEKVFTKVLGDTVDYALPAVSIPDGRKDFVSCQYKGFGDNFAWGVATAAY